MPSERCNKCKEGSTPPGDSWCIGCSALELGQSVLRQRWVHVGLRKAAEETLLSSARVVKGLCNLDKGLAQEAQEVAQGVYPKSRPSRPRSRSPRRDRRPPPPRAPTPPRVPSPRRESRRRSPTPVREVSYGRSEDSFEEESEEEEEKAVDAPAKEEERSVKVEAPGGETPRGSRPPPEPQGEPPKRREDRLEERPSLPRRHSSRYPQEEGSKKKKKKTRTNPVVVERSISATTGS